MLGGVSGWASDYRLLSHACTPLIVILRSVGHAVTPMLGGVELHHHGSTA